MLLDTAPEVREEAAALLHACMTAASQFMEFWFKWELPLPVPSDTVLGKNMGEETNATARRSEPAVRSYMTASPPSIAPATSPVGCVEGKGARDKDGYVKAFYQANIPEPTE